MRKEDLPRYRLKAIRRERQISQATLAKALFVKNTTISNWENGTRQIHLEAIQQLSAYFNVPVSYFTEKNQSTSPTQRKNNPYQKIELIHTSR
jgi:transcriptional regulator with XRE-family HTH domain